MFLIPIIDSSGAHRQDLVQRLSKLKGSMSATRKVLRWGKALPLAVAVRNRLQDHAKSPVRSVFLKTMDNISLALYFLTDHPMYLQSIGFLKLDPSFYKKLDFINNFFWLLQNLFDIATTLVEMSYLQKKIQGLVSTY
jgi:hypothetical protein